MDITFIEVFYAILAIGSMIFPFALIGAVVYGFMIWRQRSGTQVAEFETDEGMGTVRRVYFYVVAFASLMMWVNGITILGHFVLDSIFVGTVLMESTLWVAGGLALIIVGLPLWVFHWRHIERSAAEQPVKNRSVIRKIYLYLTLGVALGAVIVTAVNILQWAMFAAEFNGYPFAAVLCWGVVWMFHWRIEEQEGQPTPATQATHGLYIYIASLVGLVMLAYGVGRIVYLLLSDGYDALTATYFLVSQTELIGETLRKELAVAIVGGGVWWLHWLRMARPNLAVPIRWVYLYLFAIFGGVITALSALIIILQGVFVWALGGVDSGELGGHFDMLPGAVAGLGVGIALWVYHWQVVQREAETSASAAVSARRVYTYILAAIGTVLLASAIALLVHTLIRQITILTLNSISDGNWQTLTAQTIALAVVGVPLWGFYWRSPQHRISEDTPDDERFAISRRIFVYGLLGLGALTLLVSVSGLLFIFLSDLLDLSLSIDTLDKLSPFLSTTVGILAFLPYYWSTMRADRDAAPDDVPDDTAQRKTVTLLADAGDSTLAARLESALGYSIVVLRWADADAAMPTLTDAACAEIAQRVGTATGSRALLIPDGDGMRVLSYE